MICIVLLTFTFIVAILTTPIILTFKSQNDTTNNRGNTTDSCPEEFLGYGMNGGYSFYLEEQQMENVYMKCSIEHLKRLEKQLSAKIHTRDEINFLELCFGIMSRNGTFRQD